MGVGRRRRFIRPSRTLARMGSVREIEELHTVGTATVSLSFGGRMQKFHAHRCRREVVMAPAIIDHARSIAKFVVEKVAESCLAAVSIGYALDASMRGLLKFSGPGEAPWQGIELVRRRDSRVPARVRCAAAMADNAICTFGQLLLVRLQPIWSEAKFSRGTRGGPPGKLGSGGYA